MKKVLVAMSGGVDSSVAALKLKQMGYLVVGFTAILHEEDMEFQKKNIKDAKDVCKKLKIEHKVFNFVDSFKKDIILSFVQSYKNGKTPNPCILCNKLFKFGRFLDIALQMDCQYLATGHYAKVFYSETRKRWILKKAKDIKKDQSYFLCMLNQYQLDQALFPLQDMNKKQVVDIAKENNFIAAEKKESQDICFINCRKYYTFLEKYIKNIKPGNFVDSSGKVLAKHKGLIYYTVGQRKGIGLSFNEAMYVKKLDSIKNEVTLSCEKQLYSSSLYAKNINFISRPNIKTPTKFFARVRYRQKETDVIVWQKNDNIIRVIFKNPQKAITKGQWVVIYEGDEVVAAGEIF